MNPPSSSDIGKEKEVFSHAASNPVECEGSEFKFQVRHAVLTALVLWVFGCNITWVILDKVPPAYDYSRHLYIAFLYWQAFDWDSQYLWFDLLSVEPFYPPLYHLSLIPFAVVFGFSAYSAVLANSVYLGVIILSTYGIGSLINDRRTGLMAAFFVSCYPFLAYVSRTPMIDTMLTAAVALAYYLFLKSKNFEDRFYSLIFAIAFAGGLMVKWTFLFFVLPAVILGLIGGKPVELKRTLLQFIYYFGLILVLLVLPFFIFSLEEWRWVSLFLEMGLISILVRAMPLVGISLAKIINLITLTVVSLVICFPWYSHAFLNLVQGISKHSGHGLKEGDPTAGVDFWMTYTWILQSSVGGILFLLFLIGVIFFLVRKKYFNPLLIGWVALPYIVFTLMINKDMRYILPVLPCIAVISSFWIFRIQRDVFRRTLIGLAVVVGLFTHLYSGFFSRGIDLKVFGVSATGYHSLPVDQYWPLDRVLNDIIAEVAPDEGEAVTVRTLTNHPYFQSGGFRNMTAFNNFPIVMKSVKRNVGELTDFFITKEGMIGPGFAERDIGPKKKKLQEDPALRRTFPLFKKYFLPDGTYGMTYKRDVSPANDIKGVDDLNEVGKRFLEALSEYPIYGIKGGDNITVFIEPTENPGDLFLGRYKSIRVRADSAVTNSIQLHDFELIFEGAQINLYDLFLNGKLIFFELDRIYPRGTIRFEELEGLAAKAMKGQGEARLEGQEDRLVLGVNYRLPQGFDVKGKAIIRVEFEPGRSIKPILELLNFGPVSVPQAFYRRMTNIQIPLTPTRGWPFYTDIHSVRIYPRHLEINQLRNRGFVKVSVLCFDLSNNSFGRAVLLAQALSGFCDVEIVGPSRRGDIWFPLRQTSFSVKSFEWKRYPFFIPVVQRILKEIDGDVILASKLMPTSFGIGLLKKWASGKPLIVDIDDWELGFFYHSGFWGRVGRLLNFSNPNGLPHAWLMERLTRYADAVMVSSRFLQNRFDGTLVPHCRDTSILDPKRFDSEATKEAWGLKGKTVLMFLGTPRPHKGIDDLRMALEKIDDPEAYLLIVGADDPAVFSGTKWAAVRERVRVFPKIPFENLPKYLAAADILLVPQRQTTDSVGQMPAKLFDAMAMGKPIVATRVSDITEVLGGCGYLVDPDKPAQLADAIQYILDHPEEARRRGQEARERCKRLYDIKAMEAKIRGLIETVVSE